MTKHFCDRCGNETKKPQNARLPYEFVSDSSYEVKEYQLCEKCKKDLDKLENCIFPQIAKLKMSVYQNFMDYLGGC